MKVPFSEDVSEFLSVLSSREVRYVIVGGEAVIYYGHARLTGDIDIFYEGSEENVSRLYAALSQFWLNDIPGMANKDELMQDGMIFQFGVPPNRIDLINEIEGVRFKEAWENRVDERFSFQGMEVPIYYIGLDELVKNKKALGRHKDIDDLEFLTKVQNKRK